MAASLTYGATGGSSAVSACVDAKSGAARIVADHAGCRRGENAMSWGAGGAAGRRGAGGVAGDTGPAGTSGAAGDKGPSGSFSFDSFQGMPCTRSNQQPGTIGLSYGPSGQVTFTCG